MSIFFHAFPIKRRDQNVYGNNSQEEKRYRTAFVNGDRNRYNGAHDRRNEYVVKRRHKPRHARNVVKKLRLNFSRFHFLMVCYGKPLKFSYNRAFYVCLGASEHLRGAPCPKRVHGNILQKRNGENNGVNYRIFNRFVIAYIPRKVIRRKIYYVGSYNGYYPDRRSFDNIKQRR